MSLNMIIVVAIGGALGAVGRFLITSGVVYFFGNGLPPGTLIVNIIGSFGLGILMEVYPIAWSVSPELRSFFVVGLLGAFTTFSTFSFEAVSLWLRGDLFSSGAYVIGSVFLGIVGFICGSAMAKSLFT